VIIKLGRVGKNGVPDTSNCFKKLEQAKAHQKKMANRGECGKNNPRIYSIHLWNDKGTDGKNPDCKFDETTGRADLSNWDMKPRPTAKDGTEYTNFDFGWVEDDGTITAADGYHNPDLDGDGKGDYIPNLPIKKGRIFNYTLDEWQKALTPHWNEEVWCVACDGGDMRPPVPKD
jgi:hypothetical protein